MKTHFQDNQGDDSISFLFQYGFHYKPSLSQILTFALEARLDKPKEVNELQSHAAECALHYGIPAALVDRAKTVT